MRIVVISDTHNQHARLKLPKGDMLIQCGDFTGRGLIPEAASFLQWFIEQDFAHKILIAGNHDFLAEADPVEVARATGVSTATARRMQIFAGRVVECGRQPR